jgi:hypothetical protein
VTAVCEGCGRPLNPAAAMLGPVCGYCVRLRHAGAVRGDNRAAIVAAAAERAAELRAEREAAKLERMRAAAAAPAAPLTLQRVGRTGRAWRVWRGARMVADIRTGSGRRYLVVREPGGFVVKRSDSLETARTFARRVAPAFIIDSARGELVS